MDEFQDRYRQRFNSWADIYTVTSYDAVKLISEVIAKTGVDPGQIKKGLREAERYEGMFGPLKFGESQCVVESLSWKTVRNGQFTLVGLADRK